MLKAVPEEDSFEAEAQELTARSCLDEGWSLHHLKLRTARFAIRYFIIDEVPEVRLAVLVARCRYAQVVPKGWAMCGR